MKKLVSVVLCVLMMVGMFAFAGCTPKVETVAEEVAVEVVEEVEEEVVESAKLAWYVPAPHPYFEAVKVGVDAFTAETGMDVITQIGPDWNQDSQNTGVSALFAKGYEYISVYPADGSAANGLYGDIVDAGGSIVNFGGSTELPTPASLVFMTSMVSSASDAMEYVINSIGDEGNIMVVIEVLEDPNTVLRLEGVNNMLDKYPNVKMIEVAGMTTEKEALEKMESSLAANEGKVDGIVALGFTAAEALARILEDYETTTGTHIPAIGIDDSELILDAIRNGYLDATYAQNPFGHGYLSMYALKLLSEGYTPVDGIYNIDAGSVIVTIDNVDSYSVDLVAVTDKIKEDLPVLYLTK